MNTFLPESLMRLMRRFAWAVVALTAFLAGTFALVWLLGLQPAPHTPVAPAADKRALAYQLAHGRFLQRTLQGEQLTFAMSWQQLNSLLSDVAGQAIGARAMVQPLKSGQVRASLSVPIHRIRAPRWLPERWVNLETLWQTHPDGQFSVESIRCGHIPLPTILARFVVSHWLHKQQLNELAEVGFDTVNGLQYTAKQLTVSWQWGAQQRGRTIAALIPPAQLERIYQHHLALVGFLQSSGDVAAQHGGDMPMVDAMKAVFLLAQQRTLAQMLASEGHGIAVPVQENRAAIFVLTLQALNVKPSAFIAKAADWPVAPPYRLVLREREDFAQHYLLSALLASGFGGKLVDIVGIYKEKADKWWGSGFSFNDVAADRAGVRFGQQARLAAEKLQSRVQEGQDESFFMPEVADMPQFLSSQDFMARFGQGNSEAYISLLNLIDQRVAQLGVLQ